MERAREAEEGRNTSALLAVLRVLVPYFLVSAPGLGHGLFFLFSSFYFFSKTPHAIVTPPSIPLPFHCRAETCSQTFFLRTMEFFLPVIPSRVDEIKFVETR